ncbi:MAG: hypothetical protein RI913_79 [Pseudomonadota bacterium]
MGLFLHKTMLTNKGPTGIADLGKSPLQGLKYF